MPEPADLWPFAGAEDAADTESRDRLARAFARCFAGSDGEAVLAHLRAVTLGRCLGPDASSAALRDLEGQRRLVRAVLALIESGRAGR